MRYFWKQCKVKSLLLPFLTQKTGCNKMHSYYNANEKEIYLFPNKLGYIEITFYKGAIAMLGDLKINDTIEIQFT